MIVTCREMQELEKRAFALGSSAEELMEEAGRKVAAAIARFCPLPGECRVVYGKGHNGGDALVAARYLLEAGWRIVLAGAFPEESLAPLTAQHLASLQQQLHPVEDVAMPGSLVVIDGLLGIGASGELRPPISEAAAQINRWREEEGAIVFAIDLPSGLCGNSGMPLEDAVTADYTLTLGFAKTGLVADEAVDHTGRLVVLDLPALSALTPQPLSASDEWPTVTTPATLRPLLPRRRFNTHKGDCGRVGVIAGSRGLIGAAVMASEAVIRGGAGLVTLFVKEELYPLIAPMVRPEVMTRPVQDYRAALDYPLDALAIGPGLGMDEETADDLLAVIVNCPAPAVVDADALNLLASSPERLEALLQCAGPRLLTPHPGEMRRLHPKALGLSRKEAAHDFLKQFRGSRETVTLLLKGARTLIAEEPAGRNLRLAYNTTGSPGMATGGMGDVLTGLCAALMAQGLEPFDAARAGAWLAGRAAELALTHGWQSQESLCATDLPGFLGAAFGELRSAGAV